MRQDAGKKEAHGPKSKSLRFFPKKKRTPPSAAESSSLDWDELAFLLQIDLALGREKAFVRRLKRAVALAQA